MEHFKRAARWIAAILIGVVVIWFAVANRELVAVTLDPLPFGLELPVFAVAFAALMIGFVAGAVVAWIGGRKWRKLARARKREVASLSREVARLGKRAEGGGDEVRQLRPMPDAG